MVLNKDGVILKAKETAEKANKAIINEQTELSDLYNIFDEVIDDYKEYKIEYKFTCENNETEIPKEISEILPVDKSKYKYKDLKIIQPEKTFIDLPEGTWRFLGYDITKLNDTILLTGKWKFEKNFYIVEYSFVSGTQGVSLEDCIIDLVPLDTKEYEYGEKVVAIKPLQTRIDKENGYWIFDGYDKDEKIAVENINFEGIWRFISK